IGKLEGDDRHRDADQAGIDEVSQMRVALAAREPAIDEPAAEDETGNAAERADGAENDADLRNTEAVAAHQHRRCPGRSAIGHDRNQPEAEEVTDEIAAVGEEEVHHAPIGSVKVELAVPANRLGNEEH